MRFGNVIIKNALANANAKGVSKNVIPKRVTKKKLDRKPRPQNAITKEQRVAKERTRLRNTFWETPNMCFKETRLQFGSDCETHSGNAIAKRYLKMRNYKMRLKV